MVGQIGVKELEARRKRGESPFVLDVREGWELDIARLPDVVHIPMNEVPRRLGELDAAREIIVMCRSGGRSQRIAEFLAGHGFSDVKNLTGGILAWGEDVDPTVPSY